MYQPVSAVQFGSWGGACFGEAGLELIMKLEVSAQTGTM